MTINQSRVSDSRISVLLCSWFLFVSFAECHNLRHQRFWERVPTDRMFFAPTQSGFNQTVSKFREFYFKFLFWHCVNRIIIYLTFEENHGGLRIFESSAKRQHRSNAKRCLERTCRSPRTKARFCFSPDPSGLLTVIFAGCGIRSQQSLMACLEMNNSWRALEDINL